jgi:hypothetical protein
MLFKLHGAVQKRRLAMCPSFGLPSKSVLDSR